MSYSFSLEAESASALQDKVTAQYDEIELAQPIHAADREIAEAAVSNMIGLLDRDETQNVVVTVSGSVSTTGNDGVLIAASVNISASLRQRPQAAETEQKE